MAAINSSRELTTDDIGIGAMLLGENTLDITPPPGHIKYEPGYSRPLRSFYAKEKAPLRAVLATYIDRGCHAPEWIATHSCN